MGTEMRIHKRNKRKIRYGIAVLCLYMLLGGCGIEDTFEPVESVISEEEQQKNSKENSDSNKKTKNQVESAKQEEAPKENREDNREEENEKKREKEEQERLEVSKDQAIQEILAHSQEGLAGNYPVDETFFQWFFERYGMENLSKIQQAVLETELDMECWYELIGKSMHVLWVDYCRSTGGKEIYLEKVYEKECAKENQVILDFTGDINLSEEWSTTRYLDRQPRGIQDCFSKALLEEMQSADILMINNEFTYSNRGMPLKGKAYTFRANPERVQAIAELGTDILSLANNHVWDYGEEALLDTLETVKQAEIPYVGAGRNLEEAMKPVYFIANGRKIAMVSATQIERTLNYTKEATDDMAGVLKTLNPDKFLSVIQQARTLSDYVIVFVHWGTENTNDYGRDQTELGQAFVDAGADVIIGGHTHCLQGFDYFNGKPVIYSLGNYWFNDKNIDTGLSQVVIHTDTNEIDFRFLPCVQKGCVTSLVEEPEEKQRILDFMHRISAPGVSVDSDGSVTEVP